MFGDAQAELIARTETANAGVHGNLIGWKESGVVSAKQWIVAQDSVCDICEPFDGMVVGLDEESFPEGDPPAPELVLRRAAGDGGGRRVGLVVCNDGKAAKGVCEPAGRARTTGVLDPAGFTRSGGRLCCGKPGSKAVHRLWKTRPKLRNFGV